MIIRVEEEDGVHYLTAAYKDGTPVRERLLPLDAERLQKGDLPLENLLAKYCSYIRANR